ncbi:MAG: hypothetical protein ACXABG_12060 [Promethearchaeota archaeon]|jgi:tetratricopeptide (TPR) repeat protein
MSGNEKIRDVQNNFENFVNFIIKITEFYRYEGKIDNAILIFKSNLLVMDLQEVRDEDKAKFLIQYAKILQQSKFIKEFNYDNEIQILNKARDLAESSNAKNLIADALDLIGTCIYSAGILEGDYQNALEYFDQALVIRNEINDLHGLCKSYFNLGLYNENIKDASEDNKRKSFNYYQKGLKIAIEKDYKLEQAYFYRHLAYFYQYFKNDKEKSLQYHLNSAKIREEIGFKISLQFAYFSVAMEYFFLKDYKKSINYFKKAYTWAIDMNRVEQLKVIIFRRGNQMVNANETENVNKFYGLVLESANKTGDIEGAKEIENKIKDLSTTFKKE